MKNYAKSLKIGKLIIFNFFIEIEYQNMCSIVILCALLLGSICFMSGQYFLIFLGENPYFIKKSHIRRFDYIVNSLPRNVVSLELWSMIPMKGSL